MKVIIILITIFSFLGCASSSTSSDNRKVSLTDLRFSSTQQWFNYAENVLRREPYALEMTDQELSVISPPPKNNSSEVEEEVRQLILLQSHRTPQDVIQIVEEFSFCGWNMAGYRLGSVPEQDDEIIKFLYDASKIGFKLKKKFDRVRPSYLNAEIEPAIDVPQHASYPSNHSLESHFLALILADLYPSKKAELLNSADRIAKNREIAGVHYASDSEVGVRTAIVAHQKISRLEVYRNFLKRSKNISLLVRKNGDILSSECKKLIQKNVPK